MTSDQPCWLFIRAGQRALMSPTLTGYVSRDLIEVKSSGFSSKKWDSRIQIQGSFQTLYGGQTCCLSWLLCLPVLCGSYSAGDHLLSQPRRSQQDPDQDLCLHICQKLGRSVNKVMCFGGIPPSSSSDSHFHSTCHRIEV